MTVGENENTQESEGNPGFHLLTGRNCCSDIFLFSSALPILTNFSNYSSS
jgi:hypothetical protein